MTEISFTSTYRIPITQAGVNPAKKAKLKELVLSYPNGLCGNNKVGNARVSIPDNEDENFVRKLKQIGYKIYQKFEGENIPKEEIDFHIKHKLDTRDYSQKGKNMKRSPKELKDKHRFEKNYTISTYEKLLNDSKEGTTGQTSKTSETITKSSITSSEEHKAKIRQSEEYRKCATEYGEDFAEAVFFNHRASK